MQVTPHPGHKVYIVLLFIVSDMLAHAAGITFDAGSLIHGTWQLINPELLKTNLLESLFYLHSQPPLYNLFVGTIIRLFPENYDVAFHVIFFIIGLLNSLALYTIIVKLEVRPWIAIVITTLFIVSPGNVLYSHWLSYTYPVMGMLCFSVYFLMRFLSSGKMLHGVIFFSFLALIILTRSMFHIVWLLVISAVIVACRPNLVRKVVIAMLVPAMIVLMVYTKNYLLFGSFSTSTWFGMNLSEVALRRFDKSKLERMVNTGELDSISLKPAFWSLDNYSEFITQDNPYPDIRALTDSFNLEEANYHNYHYIEISNLYKKQCFNAIAAYPGNYLRNVIFAFGYYFYPSNNYPLLRRNENKIFWYTKIYNHVVNGTLYNPNEIEREPPFKLKYALSLSFTTIFLYALIPTLLFTALRKRNFKVSLSSLKAITAIIIIITIAYVMVIGNFFEEGENMRFRFQTVALSLIIAALSANYLYTKLARQAERTSVDLQADAPAEVDADVLAS